MEIALADLSYLSKDDYTQPLPLNVGYIGAYLKQEVRDAKIEIFKDPKKLYDAFMRTRKRYTCLALSNYEWNFNLNRQFIRMVKRKNPGIITVMGGPNVDSDSDEELEFFFRQFPGLDFYIIGEGEYKFTRLVKNIMARGRKISGVWEGLPKTIIGFDQKTGRISRGLGEDIGPCDCNTLPSPYLTGLLDEFLDDPHLAPIIETSRGCPYSCAFCCWGNSINSKVRPFSKETVLKEMEYISLRTKNPKKAFYIADSNFGILKRDIEIAQALKEINIKYGSLENIFMFFAKDTNEDIVKIAEMLKEFTDISMSKQTLNPDVLGIIGRKNIADSEYGRFYRKLRQLGASTFCELIYGFPGESLQSFWNGLQRMSKEGVKISLYPLLLVKGSRMNSKAFRERYNIKSAFRIMPRYVGTYGRVNSAEYEEILVSHSKSSEDDYFRFRLIVFCHVLFSQGMFTELAQLLKQKELTMASFSKFIIDDRINWPPLFEDLVSAFETDVRHELVEKKNVKRDFTENEIKEIKNKAVDQNTYHFCRLISSEGHLKCFRQYLSDALGRFFLSNSVSEETGELNDVLDICFDKVPDFPDVKQRKTKYYPYDLDSWLKEEGASSLSSFKTAKKLEYVFELDEKSIGLFEKHYNELKNIELSLYRTRKHVMVPDPSAYRRSRVWREGVQLEEPS